MSDILCVTNRTLCKEDFLTRIERIAACRPKAIILREKDLAQSAYQTLARQVIAICQKHGTACILHSFPAVALALQWNAIHLPLPVLRTLSAEEKAYFTVLGASCHSVEEAKEAETLGCTYITAGHIFDTACKKDLPGRGTAFLQEICKNVSIPVYGIGGIDAGNMEDIRKTGAAGGCVMSSMMVCEDVKQYLTALEGKHGI